MRGAAHIEDKNLSREAAPIITMKQSICSNCGSNKHSSLQCFQKPRKRISQRGQKTLEYETFRDTVAIPYLDKRYGHVCSVKGCPITENLDVDHIRGRGSHPQLKFDVMNLRYLCRLHHSLKTDGKLPDYRLEAA